MKIHAIDLKPGQIIKFGHLSKRIKEVLFLSSMVQLTLIHPTKPKSKISCMNVCHDFEFILISDKLVNQELKGVNVK